MALLPGQGECFYEDNQTPERYLEVEVFVMRGGDLDVLLEVRGPLGRMEDGMHVGPVQFSGPVKSTMLQSGDFGDSYRHRFKAMIGLYEVCLINSKKLTLDTRIVQLTIGDPKEDTSKRTEAETSLAVKEAAEKLDLPEKMAKYAPRIAAIKTQIEGIKDKQEMERHRLAIHSALNRSSHKKMVISSIVETVVFFIVSFFQIFYIRRWFAGRGLTKQWA